MNHSVVVKILGREYAIRSQQTPEQVQRAADFVAEKLAETAAGRAVDTRDLTVLTLLNLAGEHLQLRDLQQHAEQERCALFQQLINQMDAVNSGCES